MKIKPIKNHHRNKWYLFICFSIFYTHFFYPKILMLTHAFNCPEFIEIQHKTFQRFLKDDYEFVVFSDAKTEDMHGSIVQMCNKYNLRCIRVPQEIQKNQAPSMRHAQATMYSLDVLGFDHDDIVVIIDSDMFLIKELSIRSFFQGYHLAGVNQNGKKVVNDFNFLWLGLLFLNMPELPNKKTLSIKPFYLGDVYFDSGGETYYYLKNNPTVKARYIDSLRMNLLNNMVCQNCLNKAWANGFYRNETDEIFTYVNECDICKNSLQCAVCREADEPSCKHNTELLQKLGFDDNQIFLIQTGIHHIEFLLDKKILHYRAGSNWEVRPSEYHDQKKIFLNEFLNKILL